MVWPKQGFDVVAELIFGETKASTSFSVKTLYRTSPMTGQRNVPGRDGEVLPKVSDKTKGTKPGFRHKRNRPTVCIKVFLSLEGFPRPGQMQTTRTRESVAEHIFGLGWFFKKTTSHKDNSDFYSSFFILLMIIQRTVDESFASHRSQFLFN